MAYDESKVNWSPEEHDAAENADKVYEAVSVAVADGLNTADAAVAFQILQPSMKLWSYLAGGTKEQFASKLIDLGVMLKRDNNLI
jgi:hypothetical protein